VMVRFLSAIDYDDDNLVRPVVEYGNGKEREATVCEQADAEWRFDQTQYAQTDDDLNPIKDAEGNWVPVAGLQGDPSSRMAEVVCTLDDTGEFTLTSDLFDDALAYVGERQREAGGVIFTFTRSNRIDADIPDAKDQYDQRHEISPIQVSAAVSRFGRFWWDGSAVSGNE